jgi:type IV secretion system protein VirB9
MIAPGTTSAKILAKMLALLGMCFCSHFCLLTAHAAPGKRAVPEPFVPPVAVAAPQESRIVSYTYSPDQIFRIYGRVGQVTHIELPAGEGVVLKPQLGDALQWRVSGGPRHLFLKPVQEAVTTSMTVVTNLAQYQFQLISGKADEGPFYQKVRFDYPDRIEAIQLLEEKAAAGVATSSTSATVAKEAAAGSQLSQLVSQPLDVSALDFRYDIVGEAPFRPQSAFSSNKFTYLKMPDQNLPVIFALDASGKATWVNYTVRGIDSDVMVVQAERTPLLLKSGNLEVRILPQNVKK